MMRIRNQIIVIPLFCLVFCYLLIITITLAKSRHVARLNLSIDEDEGNNDMDFKGIFELDLHPDMSADNFLLAYNRYCTAVFNPPYTNLPPCDCVPTTLEGPIHVDISSSPDVAALEHVSSSVKDGGMWRPWHCVARQRVAVIIPYQSNKRRQLHLLLSYLHPMLQRQQLEYVIVVAEQAKTSSLAFSKSLLLNAAYLEARKLADFDCFVFHDVNLIPEDDRNFYTCTSHPRHISAYIRQNNQGRTQTETIRGVTAFTSDQFEYIDGFSNTFFTWEDIEEYMFHKVDKYGWKPVRYPESVAKFNLRQEDENMITPAKPESDILLTLFRSGMRRYQEGLQQLYYESSSHDDILYTHIIINFLNT